MMLSPVGCGGLYCSNDDRRCARATLFDARLSRDGCGAIAGATPNSPSADLPRLARDGLAPAVIKGDVRHFLLMGARHRSFLSARRCEPQQRHAACSRAAGDQTRATVPPEPSIAVPSLPSRGSAPPDRVEVERQWSARYRRTLTSDVPLAASCLVAPPLRAVLRCPQSSAQPIASSSNA